MAGWAGSLAFGLLLLVFFFCFACLLACLLLPTLFATYTSSCHTKAVNCILGVCGAISVLLEPVFVGSSWLFQNNMNVWTFMVDVALWVYAGVRERCRVVAFLAFLFVFGPFFFLVPCSLFPVPCSLFPVPCSLFPVPCFLFLFCCIALPCPALPCPALPCPALPCPALPCPALPWPCLALPCLACSGKNDGRVSTSFKTIKKQEKEKTDGKCCPDGFLGIPRKMSTCVFGTAWRNQIRQKWNQIRQKKMENKNRA